MAATSAQVRCNASARSSCRLLRPAPLHSASTHTFNPHAPPPHVSYIQATNCPSRMCDTYWHTQTLVALCEQCRTYYECKTLGIRQGAPVPHFAQVTLHPAQLAGGDCCQNLRQLFQLLLRHTQRKGGKIQHGLKRHVHIVLDDDGNTAVQDGIFEPATPAIACGTDSRAVHDVFFVRCATSTAMRTLCATTNMRSQHATSTDQVSIAPGATKQNLLLASPWL